MQSNCNVFWTTILYKYRVKSSTMNSNIVRAGKGWIQRDVRGKNARSSYKKVDLSYAQSFGSGSFGRIRIFRSNPDLSVKSDWWKRTFSVFLVVGSRSSFSNTWISINHVLTDQNSNNSKNIAWTFFPWPIKYYFKLTYKILASHLNDGFVNFLYKYL